MKIENIYRASELEMTHLDLTQAIENVNKAEEVIINGITIDIAKVSGIEEPEVVAGIEFRKKLREIYTKKLQDLEKEIEAL